MTSAMTREVSGTEGYADEAEALAARYESLKPTDVHRRILHLIPPSPARVVDIGAGTGRDAAWLASLGHEVVAVEPTAAMRSRAMALHPSPAITWLDDSLPDLGALRALDRRFDLVMLTGVFMHLDADQRGRALPHLATLMAEGATLCMRLRHGPVPPGRRMFDVTAAEVIALGEPLGLRVVLNQHGASTSPQNVQEGVTWTTLALRRA